MEGKPDGQGLFQVVWLFYVLFHLCHYPSVSCDLGDFAGEESRLSATLPRACICFLSVQYKPTKSSDGVPSLSKSFEGTGGSRKLLRISKPDLSLRPQLGSLRHKAGDQSAEAPHFSLFGSKFQGAGSNTTRAIALFLLLTTRIATNATKLLLT
ncbi:hypothetical protein BDW67DRAFT_38018 [Aspergillus spinulosporus]